MLRAATRRLKDLVRSAGHHAGLEIRRYGVGSSPAARRQRIFEYNEITLLLDVGANMGQFAREVRRHGYKGRIVSFEPQAEPFRVLSKRAEGDPLWECRKLALGDTAGVQTMSISQTHASSSFLPMLERHLDIEPRSRYVGTEDVLTDTLDSATGAIIRPHDRTYLKLDVQGFESRVLGGGAATMERASVIELEMLLAPVYAGQASFFELVELLHRFDFEPVAADVGYVDPVRGYAAWLEAIFVSHTAGTPP